MSSRTSNKVRKIMEMLEHSQRGRADATPPIMEQLRQCPDAFKVGEILGKAFDSLKYRQEEVADGDRVMPPPGSIIPPFA